MSTSVLTFARRSLILNSPNHDSRNQSMTFVVDVGAEHSVVTTPVAPLTG